MTNKKDFLSSLAKEIEDKEKGIAPEDSFEIYKTSSKTEHDIKSFTDDNYRFKQSQSETVPPKQESLRKEETPKPKPVTKESLMAKDASRGHHQEVLEKVDKKPIKIDPKLIIGGVVALIAVAGLVWYFFFAPKIVMPQFIGKTVNDVGAWAKQNGIEVSGIVINSEFSMEYDKDVIISQSKKEGSKIKNTTPLTFVASKGADPDEVVAFPDLMNMTYSEIKDWIETNKLQKTKINTQYNTLVEKDLVINYDLKTGTESNFTRGSTLTINISKGAAPAGTVAIENFVGKTFVELEQWANQKKILLDKTEAYSDTVEIGKIISQGTKVGESLEEGGTFSVVVSKGKAVKIPNLVGYTKEMLEAWVANKENNVAVIKKERYNSAAIGTVVDQSIKAGSAVDQGSVLELTISLYMPQLETNSREWYGKDYLELIKWVDDANGKGANLAAGSWLGSECSDEFKTQGQIMEYKCLNGSGEEIDHSANGCARPLPLDGKITMKVSTGACTVTTPTPEVKSFTINKSLGYATFEALCKANGITIAEIGTIPEDATGFIILKADGTTVINNNEKLTEGDSVIVKVGP